MKNPAGYLYRVGRSKTRRIRRPTPTLHATPVAASTEYEPGLPEAISRLSPRQRVAVMLVHGFEWTQAEAADLMGIASTSIQKHTERGLTKLRRGSGDVVTALRAELGTVVIGCSTVPAVDDRPPLEGASNAGRGSVAPSLNDEGARLGQVGTPRWFVCVVDQDPLFEYLAGGSERLSYSRLDQLVDATCR